MITITGHFSEDKSCFGITENYIVDIPVNSFDDICEDNMPIEQSDKIIATAILNKYGIEPQYIFVDSPK